MLCRVTIDENYRTRSIGLPKAQWYNGNGQYLEYVPIEGKNAFNADIKQTIHCKVTDTAVYLDGNRVL